MKHFSEVDYKELLLKKSYVYRGNIYTDDIICFDIETTSCWLTEGGNIVPDCNYFPEKWYNKQQPLAFSYEWSISINGTAFYGRNLEEAVKIFKEINSVKKRIVWVHNLGFEFVFLAGLATPTDVFARNARHPIKVNFKEFENLEFRCSYMLTRLSLENWGKKIGKTQKLSNFNYSKIRTPKTKLTIQELQYCENDVLVMYDGLKEEIKRYGHLKDIPLTQTGKVRREVKKILCTKEYLQFTSSLVPEMNVYRLLLAAYWGGYVHANYMYVGRTVKNVKSFDFKSSYPFCMVACKFPMTPWRKVSRIFDVEKFAYLIHIKATGIKSITKNTFISKSKCINAKGIVRDNGRIMFAKEIEICMTELDYEIFHKSYKIENEEIVEIYESKKGYLPRNFILYVLQLYGNKTSLRNIDGYEDIYLASKEELNALYGMMCSAVIFDALNYNNETGEWSVVHNSDTDVSNYLDKLRNECNKKNFVAYAWGCWVVAWARYHLWTAILANDENNVYSDTDSNKVLSGTERNFLEQHNSYAMRKIKESARVNRIPLEKFMPKDSKGNTHIIGTFDNDGIYTEFRTLGSKRYAYKDKDGDLHITVSGVPKGAVVGLNDDIEKFDDDFIFDRSLERDDGKKCVSSLLYYINNQPFVKVNKGKYDEYRISNRKGIAVRRKSYSMKLSKDFKEFLISKKIERKGCYAIEKKICKSGINKEGSKEEV